MGKLKSYQDLEVWKQSIELVAEIYQATKTFPSEERFGLTSQVRRASVSIPSNIAEGAARQGTAEFLHFISIAQGSLAEVETQLILSHRLQFLDKQKLDQLVTIANSIGRMLAGLKKSLVVSS